MSKAKRGWSFTLIPGLDTTPKELDRATFAAVKPPNSSMHWPRFRRASCRSSVHAVPQ